MIRGPISLDILLNPEAASADLALRLKRGELLLVLGAGASIGIGLKSWWQLARRCQELCGLSENIITEQSSEKYILRGMELIKKLKGGGKDYLDLIKTALYEGIEYNFGIIKDPLLISLGALIMGSIRGNISSVITYNFDDVLEWYLSLHGFSTQTIFELPNLEGKADVHIYHPHGFLPKREKFISSKDIIFDQESYDLRIGNPSSAMNIQIRQMLRSKVSIFIGLSGDDPTFGPMITPISKDISGRWPLGYWLFGGISEPKRQDIEYFTGRGIVPIYLKDHSEIPIFLLRICQTAATL